LAAKEARVGPWPTDCNAEKGKLSRAALSSRSRMRRRDVHLQHSISQARYKDESLKGIYDCRISTGRCPLTHDITYQGSLSDTSRVQTAACPPNIKMHPWRIGGNVEQQQTAGPHAKSMSSVTKYGTAGSKTEPSTSNSIRTLQPSLQRVLDDQVLDDHATPVMDAGSDPALENEMAFSPPLSGIRKSLLVQSGISWLVIWACLSYSHCS
jgi:hypothetical protein